MRIEFAELTWVDEGEPCSLSELAERSGLAEPDICELLEIGAIVAIEPAAESPRFSARALLAARTASRLQRDFELDVRGIALALALLERLTQAEAELAELRARMPR